MQFIHEYSVNSILQRHIILIKWCLIDNGKAGKSFSARNFRTCDKLASATSPAHNSCKFLVQSVIVILPQIEKYTNMTSEYKVIFPEINPVCLNLWTFF